VVTTAYAILEKLIRYNRPQEPLKPEGFVIHSTATPGATAQNEYNYFNSANRGASAHYFLDWIEIIRTIPESEISWHAGFTANHRFLSVEMCEPYGTDSQKFEEVWKRTVWLVADACIRYGWSTENIWSHRKVSESFGDTDHGDPIGYLTRHGRTWEDLIIAIQLEMQNIRDIGSGGGKTVENIILVGRGPDERAAGYLADFLKAPVLYLDGVKQEYLDVAKKIFVVGGIFKPLERAILLSGDDRYATCQRVLDYIRTGS
jgi:N-acetylmuramoyl-L-alanine amidase